MTIILLIINFLKPYAMLLGTSIFVAFMGYYARMREEKNKEASQNLKKMADVVETQNSVFNKSIGLKNDIQKNYRTDSLARDSELSRVLSSDPLKSK